MEGSTGSQIQHRLCEPWKISFKVFYQAVVVQKRKCVFPVCTLSGVPDTYSLCIDDTESIILISLLHCSDANENLNLLLTIVYNTVLALMWTTQQGSGHIIMHPCDLLRLHLFLWCQYYRQLQENYGCGAVKMWESIAAGRTGAILPILAPVPMSTVLQLSVYHINLLHGPTHFRWRLLKLFDTQDQLSSCARSAAETLLGKKTQKTAPALGCLERK